MAAKPRVFFLIFLALFSGAVQFALAIAGWGGWSPFFSHPALVGLAIATIALMAAAPFVGGNVSSGEQEDRGNRWVLWAFSIIALVNAYLPAYADRHAIWTFGGDTLRWAGIVLYLAGGGLRLLPVIILGNRFSGLVAIQPNHELETTGLYSVIRNPSYLGLLVCMLGWEFAFRSGIGLILVALMLPPLIARMHAEEKLLRAHFGGKYEAYFKRTWRLIPWIY